MTPKQKIYTAEPTLAQFHLSTAFVRYVGGPFGSGKSSGCVMDIVMRAMRQQPDKDGVRWSRWAVIRNTYPELKSTTIKTFQQWVPDEIAPVVYSIPITAKFIQRLNDGTTVNLEFVFIALDSPEDVSKLLSFELTGAYINEAREIPWEIIEGLLGRLPRFPATEKDADGKTVYGPTEPGIIMDSNPPKTTHWLYDKFDTGAMPNNWAKFIQPPAVYRDEKGDWALNPDAENLSHLPDNYYQQQLDASTDDFIRVNLGGEFGMSRKGKPVFGAKYAEHKHVASEIIKPARGYPIIIGQDFGLTPAIVLTQLTNQGIRILDELPATDETLEDFLDLYLSPLLLSKYQGYSIVACGDPAGKGRSAHDKRTSFSILSGRGIKAYPAITNDIAQRIGTVNWFLGRDGGFLISPHCVHLRDAMSAGYVFREAKNAKGATLDTPDKNEYSHIADALEYACLFARYGNRQVGPKRTDGKQKTPYLYA